ncbi:hypothetical protein SKC41_29515 [Mycobacterium sp. 050128]|uniref:hypothetical protein n=1 Tax=Mycobacterium TaxID=1763 RepID=UPI0006CA8C82|nr:hypothetical protein [Mycobacterium intracellulare]MDM3909136.1 hypothetical protein [Mycobacterium intracellulare subsp. chimaera]
MWDDADRDLEYERARQALSQLLSARDEQNAAALVAVSAYRDEYVDGLDGGQYEAILAVPPELYDHARGEFREVIDSACADIIGPDHYAGLRISVRRPPYDPDWVAKVVGALSPRWVPSERAGGPSLDQQGA